ncbi:MAG: nucleotidyltransferase family protein [Acidobacteriota bacterium]|nr:nucleotidyltransferase family protein [Acidobacteriota bacterium]
MSAWLSACIQPGVSLRAAIRTLDESSLQIALVVTADRRLLGTVTDGDIRRGLLKGVSLDEPVEKVMNASPTCIGPGGDRDLILATMRQKQIHQIPIVDGAGRLVGLEVLDELMNPPSRPNWVILMAGGLGRRLSPLTEETPKPMLHIGGRPILETILASFIRHGFHQFYIGVNYRAETIMEHFQDGSRWGVSIEYLREEAALGTAGALSLLPQPPKHPVIVMNGDVLTKVNFAQLLEFHLQCGARGTMCVREHTEQVPYGVIHLNGHQILQIEEKPSRKVFVNAGIYVLEPEALELVPPNQVFDMTSLFEGLVQQNRSTVVFPLREYWLDVGQHSDLAKAIGEFDTVFP